MGLRRMGAAVALALAAGPAAAEGYTIHDLGEMPTREACLQRANKVLNAYLRQQGGWEVQPTEWIVYGWDLGPSDNDVAVMCPIFRGDLVNAMMVVYGERDDVQSDADRGFVAETVDRMWFE